MAFVCILSETALADKRGCTNFIEIDFWDNPSCKVNNDFKKKRGPGAKIKTTKSGIGYPQIECKIKLPKTIKKLGVSIHESNWKLSKGNKGTSTPFKYILEIGPKQKNEITNISGKIRNGFPPNGFVRKRTYVRKINKGQTHLRFFVQVSDSWNTAFVEADIGGLFVSYKPSCPIDPGT